MLRIIFFLFFTMLHFGITCLYAGSKFGVFIDFSFQNKSNEFWIKVLRGGQFNMMNNTPAFYPLKKVDPPVTYHTGLRLNNPSAGITWYLSALDTDGNYVCSSRIFFEFKPCMLPNASAMYDRACIDEYTYKNKEGIPTCIGVRIEGGSALLRTDRRHHAVKVYYLGGG